MSILIYFSHFWYGNPGLLTLLSIDHCFLHASQKHISSNFAPLPGIFFQWQILHHRRAFSSKKNILFYVIAPWSNAIRIQSHSYFSSTYWYIKSISYSSFIEPPRLCNDLTLVIEIVAMMEGGGRSWSTSYNWQERASELFQNEKWGMGHASSRWGASFVDSEGFWEDKKYPAYTLVSIQRHTISNHGK